MVLVNKISSYDKYLAQGVRFLLEEVCENLNLKDGRSLPNFFVLSADDVQSMYSFIREKKFRTPCIIIGSKKYSGLFYGISTSLEIAFLDINESVDDLKFKLRKILMSILLGVWKPCRVNNHLMRLSSLDTKIINLLMKGCSVSGIAHMMQCSVNNVSNRKRNIMSKINAKSNQELYIWATMLGYNSSFDSAAALV